MTAFSLPASVLAETLRTVHPAIPSRPNITALSGVLIDAEDGRIRLFGTDLDASISTSCEAAIIEPGRLLIPFAKLAEFAGVVQSGDITVASGKGSVVLRAGRARATVQCLEVDEYPTLPGVGDPVCELPPGPLLSAITAVMPAVAKDTTRPTLCGVLVELGPDGVTLVTADGYRLHLARLTEAPACTTHKLLVPGSTMSMLGKMLNAAGGAVSLHTGNGTQVTFRQNTDTLTGRLIEGYFPDYRKLLPARVGRTITLDATAWQQGYREATVYSDNMHETLRIVVPAASEASAVDLILRAEAETTIDATVGEGTEHELILNYRYLGDATLGAVKTLTIDYQVAAPVRAQYEGPRVSHTNIVMPLIKHK